MKSVLVACAMFGFVTDAVACSFFELPFRLDPMEQALDTSPPGRTVVKELGITRGRGPRSAGDGAWSSTSCDDIGTIAMILKPPTDDRTAADKLGYEVRIVAGQAPNGIVRLEPRLARDGRLFLRWVDGAHDNQEPIDFSIVIVAVDAAGRRGAPSAAIRIHDPRR